jgi:hypothetical protein
MLAAPLRLLAERPDIFDLILEFFIFPFPGGIFIAIGVIDGEISVFTPGDHNEMAGGGEMARAHGKDDEFAFIQQIF